MQTKQPAVYIMASRRDGTLYVGVTSDLVKRIYEHKNNLADGFTKRYGVHTLVYYELHGEMIEAIRREKQIKKWNRQWKVELIETDNPEWKDLWPEIIGDEETGLPLPRE
jgi:putative endonuclease